MSTITVPVPVPATDRNRSKVKGTFYALQKTELIALKSAKLINNSAYVHLALRMLNPFCDRPIEIIPETFAQDWSIPISSVYEAIAKLKRKGLIEIFRGKVVLTWQNTDTEEKPSQESIKQINNVTEHDNSDKALSKPRINSEPPEPILRSQNQLSKLRNDSENPEKQTVKALSSKGFSSSHTIQKSSNHPEAEEGAKLKKRLAELKIPFNQQVKNAIATYHESQIEGALKHIENTWGTIQHPLAVFLYQVPLQEVEKPGARTRVKTAKDFKGWTLEKLKHMYPNKWQEAAAHFGVEISTSHE